MPTYVYETTDPGKPTRRYEIEQRMRDEPLTVHPETGEAIARVVSGGIGFIGLADSTPGPCGMGPCGSSDCPAPPMAGGCGSGMCGHQH